MPLASQRATPCEIVQALSASRNLQLRGCCIIPPLRSWPDCVAGRHRSPTDRNVIRQQLQRHDFQERQQQLGRPWNHDDVIGTLADFLVALANDRQSRFRSRAFTSWILESVFS